MINDLVSLIIPSRDRPASFERALKNLLVTTENLNVEIIAVLDFPDIVSRKVAGGFPNIKIVTMPTNYINGRPMRKYQTGYLESKGDWVVALADDIILCDGWLHACLKWPNKGFIGLADPHWQERHLATMLMASKEYINRVMNGRFGLPWYYVWWADYEWSTKAGRIDALTFCPASSFIHDHADARSEPDSQNILARQFRNADRITYIERENAGFPENWPEV
jgi:glycosyltransferase involved in cell wall biosynthesis